MRNKPFSEIDWTLFIFVLIATLFGILMVYNASVAEALRDFGDKYHYLKLQLVWFGLGFTSLIVCSLLPLGLLKKISAPLFIFNLFLLLVTLIPGIGVQSKGARRWIDLGFFTLQPTELIKLTFSLYLANWLSVEKRSFSQFLVLIGFISFLIMLQPDLGTTVVVVAIASLVYYLSGGSIVHLMSLGVFGLIGALGLIFSSEYRKRRFMTFLNPTEDPLGKSYHIRQILIALGSGGLTGVGLGQSRQKYEYLPEATTDSIFAILAEETGFIGAGILVILLLLIVFRGLTIARKASNEFSTLLAGGIAVWLGIQVVVNLGAMVVIFPLTGLPLPFISYGGSSLVSVLTGVGILLNISKYAKK
jgi:cell division protein FtsW